MTLPPKALCVLVDIKKELLLRSVMITSTQVKIPQIVCKSNQVMRHARVKGPAIQRMYQRGEL
jgi:hypothetical protein